MVIGISGFVLLLAGFWTWKKPRQASVILWALTATLCASSALLKLLPSSLAENLLWYAATVPLIWASVQVWVYWEPKAWRSAAVLIGTTIVSGAAIALLPSPV